MRKRLLSILLAAALLISLFPAGVATVAHAAEATEKSEINEATLEALGFALDEEAPEDKYFGPGNTTMSTKNELYLNINGSSHYGWILRDNLNLNHPNWTSYKTIGAYALYGQYKNGDWANLSAGNGYTDGQTGGEATVIGSHNKQGSHLNRAYETAVEYRTSSGKLDRVAQLYVTASKNRAEANARLEIVKFVENSDGTYSECVIGWTQVNSGPIYALDESGEIFNQYYDALFDITAGDFNGDGIDDIAVYYGDNTVKIYTTKNDSLSLWKTITFTSEGILNSSIPISGNIGTDSGTSGKTRAAIVTLTAGDLKKDFSDDLVITVSMPQHATLEAHQTYPAAYIYGANSADNSISSSEFTQDLKIPLVTDNLGGDTSRPQVFKAANAAIGDLDGDSRMELVVGGRLCSNTGTGDIDWGKGGLIPVEYDHASKNYEVGVVYQTELNEYDAEDVLRVSHNGDLKYRAPTAMAIADLDGQGSRAPQLFFFAELFDYNADGNSFTATGKYLDTIKRQTNNDNKSVDKSQHWISDVVVGNFIGSDSGAEQILAIVACKESGSEWYYYYMSYIAMYDGTISAQCEGIINQARSYLNRNDVSRATPYVSIACPDVDSDSILLEYEATELVYTKPEVQAILQSAPYFQDVADVCDDYLNNGATAYGTAKGSGSGATASVEASLGVYTDVEVSAGVAMDIEAELALKTSYDHASTESVETSVEYAGAVGDDYVVMYVIPYFRYIYNATYEDGKTGPLVVEEPMTPATVIVPVDTYDEIANATKGLEPIRGNLLTSTPGDPSSYQDPPAGGKWIPIESVQMLTNAGSGGSTVTVSKSISNEKEHSFSVGVEESFKIGFGVGAGGNNAKVGLTQGLAVSGGGVFSDMTGVAYTGTVDNLPAGVSGYGFNWQFGVSEAKLNGEDIIIVGYQTSNVKQAPSMPQGLSVTEITSTSISLEWGTTPEAAMYEIFVSRDQSTWLPLDPVPATIADENDIISYTVSDLSPGTTYYFKVNSADVVGVRSLDTDTVVGTTLGSEGTFRILSQPQDTSAAKGKDAAFSIAVTSDSSSTIYYQWMYNENGKWVNISGGNSSTLVVENVTQEMDGRIFRCRVSQSANYFYSQTAELTVSKTPTSPTLTITNNGSVVPDGSTVQGSYNTTTDISTEITVWNDVVNANGYTKVVPGQFVNEGIDSYSYSSDAVYFWMAANGNLYTVNADDSVGEQVPVYYVFSNGADRDVTASTTETVAEVSIVEIDENGNAVTRGTSTTGYPVKDETGKYVYVFKEMLQGTDDKSGETYTYEATSYYVHTGDQEVTLDGENKTVGIYAQVFMDMDVIYDANGNEYELSSLTAVKSSSTETIVTGQTTQTTDGDRLTLTATGLPEDLNASTDKVYFQIVNVSNGGSFSVPATKSGDNWVAEYTFTTPGIYQITAVYGGNEVYFSSRSNTMTIYVNGATATMSIGGGSMTYGETMHFNPVIHFPDRTTVAGDVTYTVTKDGNTVSGLISGNTFTPAESGTYVIDATCKVDGVTYTTNAQVIVHTRTLTITAQDVTASLSDSEDARKALLDAEVSGLLPADQSLLSYTLSSSATTAQIQGNYRIDVAITSNRAALEKKYSVVLYSGTFTLEQSSVRVNATASANGSVNISYTTTVSDSNGTYTSTPLTVESGTLLPMGATIVITANPNNGFGVEKWSINGNLLQSTDNTYVIDNLQGAQDIVVYFTQTYNTLNFSGTEGCGTVSGVYSGSNSSFASGDRINVNQTVILTAEPADGYVVSSWMCDGEIIKAENGKDNYTGLTYTVSGVSESTSYFVTFEKAEPVEVKVTFVDKDGFPVLGGAVNINEQNVLSSDNTFTYTTNKHNNIVIKVSVPSSMLIDHWELSGKIFANAVDKVSVYDLSGSVEYLVYCTTPNQRVLTYGTDLIETNGGSVDEAGTVTAARSGVAVESGSNLPQGAVVTLTAEAAEGYRITKWTVNGKQVAGADVDSYQIALDKASAVIVYFEKKPIITLNETVNGSVNAQVGSDGVASGSFVEFGDDVQVNITPNAGYVVDTVIVNGEDVTGLLLTSGDIRYYTIADMTVNTQVSVTFKAKPIVTCIEQTDNGDVTMEAIKDFAFAEIFSGSYVDFGAELVVTVDPALGYVVESVTANGQELALNPVANSDDVTVSVDNIQADTEIVVSYKLKPVVIVTEYNADEGVVTMEGVKDFAVAEIASGSYVDYGAELSATVDPGFGYVVESIVVDGQDVVINTMADSDNVTFTVADVQADTEIVVTYKLKPVVTVTEHNADEGVVTVEATRDFTNTEISSGGYVDFGSGLSVTVAPEFGCVVESIAVDGVDVVLTAVSNSDDVTFSVANIQANTEIVVNYVAIDTTAVTFGIVDKNGSDVEGGLDGTITASVDRKGMEDYAVTDDASGLLDPVYSGSTVTFNAVPAEGYKVTKWFVNGEEVSGQPTLTIVDYMDDQLVEVQFDMIGEGITYAIIGESDKADLSATFTPVGGVAQDFASGNQPATEGTVTLTISNLDPNYEVEGWYVNGEKQEGQTGLTFEYAATVDEGAEITVNLIRCSYVVTFSATEGTVNAAVEETSIASGDVLVGDTVITFTAAPQEPTGYTFRYWTVNGEISDETSETLTIVLTEDVDVQAVYQLDHVRYTVTYGVVDTNGEEDGGLNGNLTLDGYRSNPARIRAGSNLTFIASPAEDYRVEGWYADAEGTMPIDGTTVEQLTYSTENLVADMTVYVKFEPIPEYTIDLTVTGLGTVGATVNGVAAEFVDNKLTVQRYDDVVLTATPDDNQHLTAWTVDGENSGNELTLTLTDVVADFTVTAEFEPSQTVDFETDVIGGNLIAQAGFGEDLMPIEPDTGIVINKGQNVVMTVIPHEGMMLDKWIINGVEITDYLDHTYVIENIAQDTFVQVVFVEEVLHNVPEDLTDRYVITNISETPEDYGDDRQVRDRGTVTFVVEPVEPFVITGLNAKCGEGGIIEVIRNDDGTWTVTVENVKGDIVLTDVIFASCMYRTEETLVSGGTYILTLGGNEVGVYTFTQVDGGWTIRAGDGTYLAVSGTALAHTDSAYTWTYSNGCFSATVKSSSNNWWGNWWGSSSNTTYYLASSGNTVTVSTSNANATAAFFTDHEDEYHTFDDVVTGPTCTEDGYTTHTCVNCGYTYVNEKTDALGHNYVTETVAPTCTEDGYVSETCTNCGDCNVTVGDTALGHNYESTIVKPTCTEQGYTEHICIACGDLYCDEYVAAAGHSFEDGFCTVCGQAEEGECVYLESKTLVSGETYILTLGGAEVGVYTFTQVDGGWTIQIEDGTYLALEDKTLVNSDEAFTWTYSNNRFSTCVTTESTGGWWGNWWGSGSSSTTTYYLVSSGSTVTVSTTSSAAAAAFYQEASGDHVYGDPVAESGAHIFTCVNCGFEKTEICQNPECELCHPVIPEAVIHVSVRITSSTSGGGWWGNWWGSGSSTTYTAAITVTAENADVESVAYSTNGGSSWTTGTSFTSSSEINAFDIRVIASNGETYYFQYADGTVTPVA